jgi:LysM repeat protein
MASTLEAQGNPELFTEDRNGGDNASLKALKEVQQPGTQLQPNAATDSTAAAKSLPGVTLVDGATEGVAIKGEVKVRQDQTLSHIAKENLPPDATTRDIYNYVNQIAKLNEIDKDKVHYKQTLILPEYVDPRAPKPEGKAAADAAPANPDGKQAGTDAAPVSPEAATVDNAARAAEMTKAFPTGAALLETLGKSPDGSFSRKEIDAALTALSPNRFAAENNTFDQVTALTDLQEALKLSPRQQFSAADYDNLVASMSALPAAESTPAADKISPEPAAPVTEV